MKKVLAFDFGASSGRAMLGILDGDKITLEEIHRFSNDPVLINGSFQWDILRLFFEIKQGILNCVNSGNADISAIGIDTWGVDYGLLDVNDKLISNPYHYRDSRTNGIVEKAFEMVGKEFIFNQTGTQIMSFNTVYQLLSQKLNNDISLMNSDKLLFIPDLFNYFLTGVKKTERTVASTSQLYNPQTLDWSYELIEKLGLNKNLFTEIIDPGMIVGNLTNNICEELNVASIPVVAVASHDTASAIVSVPAIDNEDYAYISCGTWSLMGVEIDNPIINEKSYSHNFTNEIGYDGKVRFLKNIMGLWIVQECKRQWEREGQKITFAQMEEAVFTAPEFVSFINPDDEIFTPPGNMPKRIMEFCAKTNQPIPKTTGEILRCVYQSLALKYKFVVTALEDILDKKLDTIHMVGGGIKDKTLCQFTADATNKKVVAGPTEATAIGNVVVSLITLGEIDNLENARKIIANSFEQVNYKANENAKWEAAYENFLQLL